MKKSLVIAVVLSLVMLVTLATPALAAKPIKGALEVGIGQPDGASGSYSLQVNRDGSIKVTVVLQDAWPNQEYLPVLLIMDPYTIEPGSWTTTSSRGSLRVSFTTNPISSGTYTAYVLVGFDTGGYIGNGFLTQPISVTIP